MVSTHTNHGLRTYLQIMSRQNSVLSNQSTAFSLRHSILLCRPDFILWEWWIVFRPKKLCSCKNLPLNFPSLNHCYSKSNSYCFANSYMNLFPPSNSCVKQRSIRRRMRVSYQHIHCTGVTKQAVQFFWNISDSADKINSIWQKLCTHFCYLAVMSGHVSLASPVTDVKPRRGRRNVALLSDIQVEHRATVPVAVYVGVQQ
jgi:hypothetical protein